MESRGQGGRAVPPPFELAALARTMTSGAAAPAAAVKQIARRRGSRDPPQFQLRGRHLGCPYACSGLSVSCIANK